MELGEDIGDYSREKRGLRDGRLRHQFAGVFGEILQEHRDDQQDDGGLPSGDRIIELLEEKGVSVTTVREMYRSLRTNQFSGEAVGGQPLEDSSTDEARSDHGTKEEERGPQNRAGRFCAEYIEFSDLTVALVNNEFEVERLRALTGQPGHFYKNKFEGGVENLTWGIVIDLYELEEEVQDFKEYYAPAASDYVLYELFFLFTMLHEHFHYLSELASLHDADKAVRYDVYDEYSKNRCKSNLHWECHEINKSCRIKDKKTGDREFVQRICSCFNNADQKDEGYTGLFWSCKGYQYPVEEAMANAYAMDRLKKEKYGIENLEDWMKGQYLGYADFDRFTGSKFKLGQRIMTRLMRGDEYPRVNQLQHELLESELKPGELGAILKTEQRLFTNVHLDNAYSPNPVHDPMKEVPLFVMGRSIGGNVVRWFNQFDPTGKWVKRPKPIPLR
jgi:hypothetical protein